MPNLITNFSTCKLDQDTSHCDFGSGFNFLWIDITLVLLFLVTAIVHYHLCKYLVSHSPSKLELNSCTVLCYWNWVGIIIWVCLISYTVIFVLLFRCRLYNIACCGWGSELNMIKLHLILVSHSPWKLEFMYSTLLLKLRWNHYFSVSYIIYSSICAVI
jgi:hypothetical protein